MRSGFGRRGRLVALSLLLALAGGCVAEENSGPQFANNPRATADLALPSPPTLDPASGRGLPAAATPPPAPLDPAALLAARGAPPRLYFRSGSEVWTIGAGGEDPRRVFAPPSGQEVVDYAASPNGDRVALLVAGEEGGATVVVVAADGREVARVDDVGRVLDETAGSARSLDWSPQGDRILVAFAPGGIVGLAADASASPELLFGRDAAAAPGEAAWSPTGEAVAFVAPAGGEEPASLFLGRTAPTPGTPTAVLESSGTGRSVGEIAWAPDGREILYTSPAAPGSANTGGDLWRIAADGSERRVVAGAGAVGFPGARVAAFAPSPDGDAVAYTVAVPVEGGARFDSLWLKERSATARSLELTVPEGEAVVRLWWTGAGLVVKTVPAAEFGSGDAATTFALYRIGAPGEAPVKLFGVGTPEGATPASGTPQAGGSPLASPAASPETG